MPGASAQTISNTASATWTDWGKTVSINSNTVSFNVINTPVTIETFIPVTGGRPVTLSAPSCGSSAESAGPGNGSTLTAELGPSTTLRAGTVFYFKIAALTANADPTAIDRMAVVVTTPSGDHEELTVFETAANSGEFVGSIQTRGIPLQPVRGDCRLSVGTGEHVTISTSLLGSTAVLATAGMDVLVDPYGLIFDSENGAPVSGARVALVDAATGAPARVFAEDGITPWPSVVHSGQPITDAAGNVYQMLPGEYRFPLVAMGNYRIVVLPPSPYSAPSKASSVQLASLVRPDGLPMQIIPASFGSALRLSAPERVRIDIPVDAPLLGVSLTKTASRANAFPGDVVFYTITFRNPDTVRAKAGVSLVDTSSPLLRLRQDSIRLDGRAVPTGLVQVSPDGRRLVVNVGTVAPGATRTLHYAMTIRADAPAGTALNRAQVSDNRGRTSQASATVRILREDLAARMTLIGRITDGGCDVAGPRNPIPGVRVVLEDGSFAVTDANGRYHFEGLVPGTHVAQALTNTLPGGGQFADCASSTRSAGNASSRFIIGQGGSLIVADFVAILPAGSLLGATPADADKADAELAAVAERAAAGAEIDWLAKADGPPEFLFPAIDHNPRAPAIRVVIRHRADQKIELKIDGKPVDSISFDGSRQAPGGRYAISIWRGVPLDGEETRLSATVRGPKGEIAAELVRDVHYSQAPARVELVTAQSRLIADGSTRPVLALRILDRSGRPVRAGLTGDFRLSSPYESAEALEELQERSLTGLGRAAPRWHVKGDDGLAYVELAPTMASGKLHAEFDLSDGQQRRRVELDTWIVPGAQPWTVVGLVEGSIGATSVADQMQRQGNLRSDLGDNARIAFYAKGPVIDGILLTASYDSAKQSDDHELMGVIDPRAYYTVFADLSDRRFDAASRDKLFARIEGKGFYAQYGDFEAGFDQTQLARYQRLATGIKAEANVSNLHVQGFGAKIGSIQRRDEFQGGGITGPYRLSSRALVPGSEVVSLEVRDRYRSELTVSRKTLVRFVDYDIDQLSGTITFKEPILSRDVELNPQFIVLNYDIEELASGGEYNGGVRADFTAAQGRLRIGASAISEKDSAGKGRNTLAAVDLRARIGDDTELRAELGTSFGRGRQAIAWLIEAEHHDGALDLLAYARYAEREFGLGQTNGVELGRRKFGLDARYRVSETLSLTASTWHDESLEDAAHRTALQLGAGWHGKNTEARVGVAMMRDHLADGRRASSTVLEGGMTERLLNNKLELSVASSIALSEAESIDLPERHRFTARYALTSDVRLVGTYELAKGKNLDARTAQFGVELSPWNGARVTTGLGQQQIGELGKRSFAAFGLAQSIPVSSKLTLDATLDGNRTVSGFSYADLVNPAHPASSGGNLGENGSITEDYTALTLGGTWRGGRWSVSLRGEWRDGELADRKGVTFGTIRQLGEGSMLGANFTWTQAKSPSGASSQVIDGGVALAFRPAQSDVAFLGKLQYRGDRVNGAVAGEAGPAGRSALNIDGSGRSNRLIASGSANWTPRGRDDGVFVQRDEVIFFAAARHNFDRFEGYDLSGTTLLGGVDLRVGIGPRIEVGATGTARTNLDDKTTSYAFGPQIGFTPTKDVLVMIGYNFRGFKDPDFSAARSTEQGLFVSLRMKFDQDLLGNLGFQR